MVEAAEEPEFLTRADRKHIDVLQGLLDGITEPGPERAALAWAIKTLHTQESLVRVSRVEGQLRKIVGRLGAVERAVAEIREEWDAQDEETAS